MEMRTMKEHIITPRQLRAVRAWLRWTQRQVAAEAQLSPQAIVDWENDVRTPHRATALALMHTMKRLRVRFDDQGNLILPR